MIILCFFFFKQKTAYEMRISDWSSDVCSSDLKASPDHFPPQRPPQLALTPSCRRRRYCCSNPSQLATTCRHSGDGSSPVGAGLLNLRQRVVIVATEARRLARVAELATTFRHRGTADRTSTRLHSCH